MAQEEKTGHTPGPWEAHRGDDYIVVLSPGDTTDRPLVDIGSASYADALLIAAAPDMLAALKRIVAGKEVPDRTDSGAGSTIVVSLDGDVIESLCAAAIAKAEGRPA